MELKLHRRCSTSNAAAALVLLLIQLLDMIEASQLERELYRSLMRGYSRFIRPVRNPSDPVEVTVGLSLVEVLDVNEDFGQLNAKMWLSMSWKDNYLRWDPDKNGGIKRLNFPTEGEDRIWIPDIVLLNAMQTDLDEGIEAVVRHDGIVRWIQPVVYKVRVRHEFRGNSWAAYFDVGSWTYDVTMIDIKAPPPQPPRTAFPARDAGMYTEAEKEPVSPDSMIDLDTGSFITNDQWGVLEHSGRKESRIPHNCCPNERYTTFHYVLKLRKKLGPSLLG